jgi:hypothetical protein
VQDIRESGYHGDIPRVLKNLLRFQSRFGFKMLKKGPVSKLLMSLSYTYNKVVYGFK